MAKQLKVQDISAKTGISETAIKKCIDHGFLQPISFTGTGIEVEEPHSGNKIKNPGRVKGDGTDPKTGKQIMGEKVKEVQKAREEGKPWDIERDHCSAEEVFDAYMNIPAGKRLYNPAFQLEVENVAKGYPPDWKGPQIFGMNHPNFDRIEWEKGTQTDAK